jgi:hypothetical protein
MKKLSLIILSAAGMFLFFFSKPVIHQDPAYHQFIDTRSFFGIPNTMDVLTNIFFLLVGFAGVREVLKDKMLVQKSWLVFFVSILLIAPGSAFYHWSPDNFTLIWDRLPMSLGFMALYVVLLSEHVSLKCEKFLPWALLLGISSVLVWVFTTDLRFYFWIQFSSFITIPMILLLYPSLYTHKIWYGWTLVFYGLAKWAEAKDQQIFQFTHECLSGHSLKHILAAIGLGCLLWMVKMRKVR